MCSVPIDMDKSQNSVIEYILVHYRWIFVCFFLLPVSFFYDIWLYFRNWMIFALNSAPKQHDNKVRNVQKQINEWNKNGGRQQMCTSRPGWQRMSFRKPLYQSTMHQININLVDILDVDVDKQIVRVEPLVTMGQLTATLMPLGWTIPVLPELDDLTVGGLVMGTGVESSSHIHGLFQNICVSYEIVLCDGSVVKCSQEENPDLYYSIPWSHGTLGFLTSVELKMIPAKRFVKLTYRAIKNRDDAFREIKKISNDEDNEFVEAIAFSKDEVVLMTGRQVNSAEYGKVNAIGKWYKEWFFIHVRNMLNKNTPIVEYIPLRDYYHRHTKSIFWELQDIVPFGNNPIFRALFGWMMPPKVSLLKLTTTNSIKKLYEENHLIQDMLIPVDNFKECIELFDNSVNVYPIWICPFKLFRNPGLVHPKTEFEKTAPELYLDIGVYGVPKVKGFQSKETTRRLEKFVAEVNGFQMLYADTYMTREEFRRMFDHTLYDRMREKLNCKTAFPEIYDKVSKTARY